VLQQGRGKSRKKRSGSWSKPSGARSWKPDLENKTERTYLRSFFYEWNQLSRA